MSSICEDHAVYVHVDYNRCTPVVLCGFCDSWRLVDTYYVIHRYLYDNIRGIIVYHDNSTYAIRIEDDPDFCVCSHIPNQPH